MTITAPTAMDARPTCAAPEHLPLVDAAFDGPNRGTARLELEKLCRRCPVATACFTFAMIHPEVGPWAGTTAGQRTRAGAPPMTNKANLRGIHPAGRAAHRAAA